MAVRNGAFAFIRVEYAKRFPLRFVSSSVHQGRICEAVPFALCFIYCEDRVPLGQKDVDAGF